MREIDDEPGTKVTVLLPRRTYAPLVGRLLHDRTADKMAAAISRVAGATAQIVAYDVGSRIAQATATARSEKNEKNEAIRNAKSEKNEAIRNAKNEKNEATRNAKALSELPTTADKLKSR